MSGPPERHSESDPFSDTAPLNPSSLHEVIARAVHDGHRRAAGDDTVVAPFSVAFTKHVWTTVFDGVKRWAGGLLFAAVALLFTSGLLLVLARVQGWIK